MARPRLEATIDLELRDDVKRYAKRYHAGNVSAAVEHLLNQGLNLEQEATRKAIGYATVAASYILLVLAAFA